MNHSDPVVERPASYEAFFHEEYRNMVALAVAVSGSRAIGEDLAQEAMLRAHRNWDRVSTYDKPGAWVRRVTLNLASSARTRFARETRARLRLGGRATSISAPPEPDEAVWRAVKSLPPGQRSAAALYYLEDRSVAEIAEIMEVAENTAKAHLHKARAALSAKLGRQYTEGGAA
jgi:RNA polymerase sigma-70 factor (ECF subfamily)